MLFWSPFLVSAGETQCSKPFGRIKFAEPKNDRAMRFVQRRKQEATIHILRSFCCAAFREHKRLTERPVSFPHGAGWEHAWAARRLDPQAGH